MIRLCMHCSFSSAVFLQKYRVQTISNAFITEHCCNYLLLLGHPWVQVGGLAPDKPLDSAVLSRMKQFSAMNKLKKMALRVSMS